MNNSVRHPHNRTRALSCASPGSKPLVMISLLTGRDMAYSQMQQLLMRSRVLTRAPFWLNVSLMPVRHSNSNRSLGPQYSLLHNKYNRSLNHNPRRRSRSHIRRRTIRRHRIPRHSLNRQRFHLSTAGLRSNQVCSSGVRGTKVST